MLRYKLFSTLLVCLSWSGCGLHVCNENPRVCVCVCQRERFESNDSISSHIYSKSNSMWLYYFSIVAVQIPKNFVIYSNTIVLSHSPLGQRSKTHFAGLKSRGWQCCISSGDPKRKSIPFLFHLLEASHIPWLKTSSPCPTSLLPTFPYKDRGNYVGYIWII